MLQCWLSENVVGISGTRQAVRCLFLHHASDLPVTIIYLEENGTGTIGLSLWCCTNVDINDLVPRQTASIDQRIATVCLAAKPVAN